MVNSHLSNTLLNKCVCPTIYNETQMCHQSIGIQYPSAICHLSYNSYMVSNFRATFDNIENPM